MQLITIYLILNQWLSLTKYYDQNEQMIKYKKLIGSKNQFLSKIIIIKKRKKEGKNVQFKNNE